MTTARDAFPRQTGRAAAALALCLGLGLPLAAPPARAQALDLTFPGPAETVAERNEALASYALPIGPWADGTMLTRVTEGTLHQTAWRIARPGLTSLEIMAPLRAALAAAGFRTLYECDTLACGGFDFRYSTRVLPEPDMHVDLGDFRFIAAERGSGAEAEHVSLLVSRSSAAGFVQMIRVGPQAAAQLNTSTKAQGEAVALAAPPALPAGGLAAQLTAGRAVLEGLSFASGAADLAPGDHAALAELAAWLAANPDQGVTLVGHTDASGSLEANVAISRRRAEAVRQTLITAHGIAPARIGAEGAGYLAPRATNDTEAGRALNRRVEAIPTR